MGYADCQEDLGDLVCHFIYDDVGCDVDDDWDDDVDDGENLCGFEFRCQRRRQGGDLRSDVGLDVIGSVVVIGWCRR